MYILKNKFQYFEIDKMTDGTIVENEFGFRLFHKSGALLRTFYFKTKDWKNVCFNTEQEAKEFCEEQKQSEIKYLENRIKKISSIKSKT